MLSELDDLAFREAVFTWLGNQMRLTETFTRDDLSQFEIYAKGADDPAVHEIRNAGKRIIAHAHAHAHALDLELEPAVLLAQVRTITDRVASGPAHIPPSTRGSAT